MPTYEYQCNRCKAVYELRQGFDAETTHKCEECGKGTAKRILHAPKVLFKGSGFYVTDSKGKNSAAQSESKGESAEPAPASSTASTESKPASSDQAAAS
ncbi:MAG: hypothetical protein IT301_02685 [Dehalococcoidia bacterium]|nr:hypothetical protein [Dehalococcoidia bacterium]